MKRFITVASKYAGEVLIILRDAAARQAGTDLYDWVKKKLKEKQIAHNDQKANHQKELPHQNGFVSFYLDQNGVWMRADH